MKMQTGAHNLWFFTINYPTLPSSRFYGVFFSQKKGQQIYFVIIMLTKSILNPDYQPYCGLMFC